MNSCATVSPAKKAAINGLSIALVFLATGFVNIRLPIAGKRRSYTSRKRSAFSYGNNLRQKNWSSRRRIRNGSV